jgi:hypothetical protein
MNLLGLISLLMLVPALLTARAEEHTPSISVGGLLIWSQVPLTPKDVGKTVVLHTDVNGYAGVGTMPPKGMITFSKPGIIYKGRVDSFTSTSVTISAPAGSKDDPTFRVRLTIDRERILKMEYAL